MRNDDSYDSFGLERSRLRSRARRLCAALLYMLAVTAVAAGLFWLEGYNRREIPAAETSKHPVATPVLEVPTLYAFSAEPAAGNTPITVWFTLETDASTRSIRLLTESGAILPAVGQSEPSGDRLTWRLSIVFSTPYTGAVRAFLKNADGGWEDSGLKCTLALQ
ncbi:MAG: hypothetical protein EOM69_09115 [Clostridia bacterium]|nr:hypothetical protein [Clostridia bacterium]